MLRLTFMRLPAHPGRRGSTELTLMTVCRLTQVFVGVLRLTLMTRLAAPRFIVGALRLTLMTDYRLNLVVVG